MQIRQFEDKNLSHFSYAILSDCEQKIILIDPARNPQQYLDYAKENEAQIIGVVETHPHADFVSSHLELYLALNATIYTSKEAHALYPHQPFDEGQNIHLGKIKLSAINTPGHSPDSICIVLEHNGKQKAVFTGDTLFVGDCGRPDLRPGNDNARASANKLAREMYNSLRNKLMLPDDETIVYPAHGAGTLCGKSLSKASSSTIGEEKKTNWSLKEQTEDAFVNELLNDQPFIPAYFPFDVELNKKGAKAFQESIEAVKISAPVINEILAGDLDKAVWIIDGRDEKEYKKGHLPFSINLMAEANFETWLGSLIKPGEHFYLAGADEKSLESMIERAASIGYETQILKAFITEYKEVAEKEIDINNFKEHKDNYTIVDVRNALEVKEKKIFKKSLSIPLEELRNKVFQIPTDKPIVVHCASGFRSAAGSSIIHSELKDKATVFDLGTAIKEFL